MTLNLTRRSLLSAIAAVLSAAVASGWAQRSRSAARGRAFGGLPESSVVTVPTYQSISIELTAPAPTRSARAGQWGACRLYYRRLGSSAWKRALDIPYDTGERKGVPGMLPAQYRGAVMLLDPNSRYEFRAIHDDGSEFAFTAATRADVDALPVAAVVKLSDRGAVLQVAAGGSADGYVVYEPSGNRRVTFNVQRSGDYCLVLDAIAGPVSHIIFSNIRFTGALKHCVLLGSTEGGNGERITDIIFDNCEFDHWGSPGALGCPHAGNLQSGIYSASTALENITVQGCHFHDPVFGSNSWYRDEGMACTDTVHPEGPQCITFKRSVGGHVFRYNTFEAAPGVRFNDGLGETGNFTDAGFPGANCDIHGNIIRHVNDDGLEIEGRAQNVRIWDNLFDDCFHGIALAPVYRGPVYIWANVGRRSRSGATRPRGQNFLKWRRISETVDWSGGHVFVVNNTLLPPIDGQNRGFKQLYGEDSAQDSIRNWHVWNNIVHNDDEADRPAPAFDDPSGINNDMRNNLFKFGWRAGRELTRPTGNRDARPTYAVNNWDAEAALGTFIVAPGPGFGDGAIVPNLFDDSSRPDRGAHQHLRPQAVGYGHLHMPRRTR